jgi:hypothetical protein
MKFIAPVRISMRYVLIPVGSLSFSGRSRDRHQEGQGLGGSSKQLFESIII